MSYFCCSSPFGDITLFEEEDHLVAIEWGRVPGDAETPLLLDAGRQLEEYFDQRRTRFDLPLAPAGTAFQKRVWQVMQTIPYGEVLTYVEIARRLDTAPRAVGQACGRNPLPVIIPCHRVVGSKGIGGFSGFDGVDSKSFLLSLERGDEA